jgi:hypothetical protein
LSNDRRGIVKEAKECVSAIAAPSRWAGIDSLHLLYITTKKQYQKAACLKPVVG